MIDYALNIFLITYTRLMHERGRFRQALVDDMGASEVSAGDKEHVHALADSVAKDCAALGLTNCAAIAGDLRWRTSGNGTCTYERASTLLDTISDLVGLAFGTERFVFVPTDKHHYFEQDNLFRLGRPHPFPSVRADIKSAGTCLALGLDTAAVYHLMRVAEVGLRALAKHLHVRLKEKKGKPLPLEYAQWEAVLNGIEQAIEKKYAQPNMPKKTKSETRAFYNGVWAEFQGFKDMYRNDVMHVRSTCSSSQAAEALQHVGAFMRRLATCVRES